MSWPIILPFNRTTTLSQRAAIAPDNISKDSILNFRYGWSSESHSSIIFTVELSSNSLIRKLEHELGKVLARLLKVWLNSFLFREFGSIISSSFFFTSLWVYWLIIRIVDSQWLCHYMNIAFKRLLISVYDGCGNKKKTGNYLSVFMIYHELPQISWFYSEGSGRWISNFFMRERRVSGCKSRIWAAPLGPLIRQRVRSSTFLIWSR